MTKTYIFGCVEKAGIKVLSVTVSGAHPVTEEAIEACAKVEALKRAEQEACEGAPQLVCAMGVPDIRIVIEGGTVVAVFYKDTDTPPTFTVSDLDSSDFPDEAGDVLLRRFQEESYISTPFFVEPVKP